jgi:hypothetical protein
MKPRGTKSRKKGSTFNFHSISIEGNFKNHSSAFNLLDHLIVIHVSTFTNKETAKAKSNAPKLQPMSNRKKRIGNKHHRHNI